jgi:hypothetical protein
MKASYRPRMPAWHKHRLRLRYRNDPANPGRDTVKLWLQLGTKMRGRNTESVLERLARLAT